MVTNLGPFFDRRPSKGDTMSTPTLTAEERMLDDILALPPELTAHDRCDACGSQAYLRVTLTAGDLFFCGHHSRKYYDRLDGLAVYIQDETHRLETLHGPNAARDAASAT